MEPFNSSHNDNYSTLSNASSNVITNQGGLVEVDAPETISEISPLAVETDVPEPPFEFFQENVVEEAEVEEAEDSSSNTNRVFNCPIHLKPVIGMIFDTLQAGIEFYETYAKECGFVTRLSSQKVVNGVVMFKKVLCNKAGECQAKGTKHRRQRTRIECLARINFKRIKEEGDNMGKYQIYGFHEGHNHMPQTPLTMVHLTQSRELNPVHKKMIIDNSKNNIGPVKSYRLFKEYVRGYRNVGASLEDFKNFARDIKKYLSEGDAQMLIEHFMKIKHMCPSFYFDFEVDEKGRLSHVFWADPISIKNYLIFGDMTSFDTTFRKNKYRMIFGPFTGVDHHKRCVTFGAGLLSNESKESFAWLFTKFLEAMGGRHPVCMITDEDAGIEEGMKMAWKDKVQHRYCMWHILKKLPEKIGPAMCKETEFLSEINSCVWGEDVEPPEFEERWTTIVESHGLSNNAWLKEKYSIRNMWVPAYFRDLFLGGLMRTTSRSESENHFFSNFTNPNLTLVEFWMRFESAMDAQRWTQSKLIAQSKNSFPQVSTKVALEKHAAEFYTPKIFSEFKTEFEAACYSCGVGDKEKDQTYAIVYTEITDQVRKKIYKVGFKKDDVSVVCTCKKFERHGILCRHALCVLKNQGIEKVPSDYLLSRWSKLATCQPIVGPNGQLLADCTSMDVQKNKVGELWSELFTCVALVEQSPGYCDELLGILREFKERVRVETSVPDDSGIAREKDKDAEIGMLLGTSIPSEIKILPPRQCKNKGSGKRLISQRERAGEVNKKPLRKCRACGEMANHDSRNCDRRARTTDSE